MRKLLRVDLDDFALQPMDGLDTSTSRLHRGAPPRRLGRVTSGRERSSGWARWPTPCWAPSAIDRLQSAPYELVLDGESYRRRQKPGLNPVDPPPVRPAIIASLTLIEPRPGSMPLAQTRSHHAGGRQLGPLGLGCKFRPPGRQRPTAGRRAGDRWSGPGKVPIASDLRMRAAEWPREEDLPQLSTR